MMDGARPAGAAAGDMVAGEITATGVTAEARPPALRRVALATLAATLAIFLAAPENLRDPFAGYDDYPTLFGWLDAYYGKTLSEGRWANFLWQYAVGPIDRHAAMLFVVVGWCATCAIMAASVFRDDRGPWRAMLFTVAMAVAPPFGILIAWSNTIVPVVAALLAYAVVAGWTRPGVAAAALLVFAPIGLMTYTTSPMIMALALALCGDWRGFRRGAALFGLLTLGVTLGVLAIYLANWRVHGVFGVVADTWRAPENVPDPADVAAQATRVAEKVKSNLLSIVHPAVWFGLVAFLATPFVAYAVIPRRSLPVLGVLAAGMGLLILNYLVSGVSVGIRAWPFFWLAFAALFALMARESRRPAATFAFLGMLALMAVGGGYFWRVFQGAVIPFQAETAALAEEIAEAAPGDGMILIYGAPERRPAINAVHNADKARVWSLSFRLHVLTGREACVCGTPLGRRDPGYCPDAPVAALCEALAPEAARLTPEGAAPAVGAGPDGVAIIRYPD